METPPVFDKMLLHSLLGQWNGSEDYSYNLSFLSFFENFFTVFCEPPGLVNLL